MAKSSNNPRTPRGTLFEYRLARLRFSQGYFVRRSIDLWPEGLNGNKLAELDCLAVGFDFNLRKSMELIECKTGAGGQGEIDRIVWLKGMGAFTKARTVTFAKPHVASRSQEFARRLGVSWLDDAGIAVAEEALELPDDWWPGFHDPDFGEEVVKPARVTLNGSPELRHAGKYLFGSFWFTEDFTRIKQLHTLFRLLMRHSESISSNALLLGVGEATTLFTFTTLSVASMRTQLVEPEFHRVAQAELSTGLGDPRSLRLLLRQVDDLQHQQIEALHAAYQRTGAGRIVFPRNSLETEILTPPEWIDAFVNLVSRLATRRHLAADLMYWTEMWAAALLGAPQAPNATGAVKASMELISAFLSRHWGVSEDFFKTTQNAKPAQQKLMHIESPVPEALNEVATQSETMRDTTEDEKRLEEAVLDSERQPEEGEKLDS